MNETTMQQEPSGLERFSHLEDKIFRLVEEFKTVRRENETLRAENQQLKEEIGRLQGNESKVQEDLVQFRKERAELKDRVEKALALIASLEARGTA
ncbi:MAG: cell division protein ZapB [Acidobacteria bacterium]|nr:cell division protein ZapB [Acidobacteriota bacterium]